MDRQRLIVLERDLKLFGLVRWPFSVYHTNKQRLQVPAAKQRVRAIGLDLHTKTTNERYY